MKRYLTLGQVLTLLLILLFAVIAFKKSGIIFKKEEVKEEVFIDYNKNEVNDYEEIVKEIKKVIDSNPEYKDQIYSGGYPIDNNYVYTDIVWLALKSIDYNFKSEIDKDIEKNKKDYNIDQINTDIDFRNYDNIKIYFDKNFKKIEEEIYLPGDFIFYKEDIGIVNDDNKIYHLSKTNGFEEDINYDTILNHYRFEIKSSK